MVFGIEISRGWMLALELGGSAFAAGLLTGLALAVIAWTKLLDPPRAADQAALR